MMRFSPQLIQIARPSCILNPKGFSTWNVSTLPNKYYPKMIQVVPPREPKALASPAQPVVTVKKSNLCQSPWKMNFLVKLIRRTWVPDALAQLKFTAKHRAVDLTKMMKRATAVAKIFHEAIPEELIVKEVFVTKGIAQKRMRIMGRGRTGIGYMRKTHVTIKVEIIDFAKMIEKAKTKSQKAKWAKIQEIASKKRLSISDSSATFQAKASE